MLASLYTVVVNWNLKEDTRNCVQSLLAAGAQPGSIIVVDNGSTDGSVQALHDWFPSSVEVIKSERNLGFAAGSNLGIKHALERDVAWILLLNNDTCVAPTFLQELAHAAQLDPSIGLFGPLILYRDTPNRIWYSGDRLIPGLLATRSIHRTPYDRGDLPPLALTDFVSGCCMLVRRDVFDRIGFLDTRFFMYGEDVDFCLRARQAGFRLAVASRAKMWHQVSASSNQDKPMSRYLRTRNQNRIYRKYARGWQRPLMLGFAGLRVVYVALGDLLRGQGGLIPPLVRGWMQGWQIMPDSEGPD